MNLLWRIIFIVIVVLILIVAIGGQIKINDGQEEVNKLRSELEELQYQNEKLKHELENPDIEKMANEQGYYDPGAEYYYSD